MTQVTNEFRAAAFAAYWGCPIRHSDPKDNPTDLAPFYFEGVREVVGEMKPILKGDWSGGTHPQTAQSSWCEWSECKLLLKDLSQISDEDAIELLKIASYHPQISDDWENIICDLQVEKISRLEECVKVKHTLICFDGYFSIGHKDNMMCHFTMQDENEEDEPSRIWQPHRLTDKLRELGYNVPFRGIDLVSAGIAIVEPVNERI